jgi:hypothetical protein
MNMRGPVHYINDDEIDFERKSYCRRYPSMRVCAPSDELVPLSPLISRDKTDPVQSHECRP